MFRSVLCVQRCAQGAENRQFLGGGALNDVTLNKGTVTVRGTGTDSLSHCQEQNQNVSGLFN